MPTTPNYSLPYPLATDPANVPLDLQELATATDTALDSVDDRVDVLEPKVATLETASTDYDARLDTLEPTIPANRVTPGSNGQVLTTVAGAAAWAVSGGGAGSYNLVQDVLLGVDGPISFTSIPAIYKHLELLLQLRAAVNGPQAAQLRFNGDASAVYHYEVLNAAAAAVGASAVENQTQGALPRVSGQDSAANRSGFARVLIFNYTASGWYRNWLAHGGSVNTAAQSYLDSSAGVWANAAVVNAIAILHAGGANFKAGSRATLYGIG